MHYSFYGETNVGKVRERNEDAFLVSDTFAFGMISDGMGGLAAGEVASQLTKESVETVFKNADSEASLGHVVNEAICIANSNVRKAQIESPEVKGMGATCVLLAFRKNNYSLGYVGDSRIYLFRNGQLKQLTTDHSYVEELFKKGLIREEEKAVHPYKNSITRYVGQKDKIQVDVCSGLLESGDRFLICSDGLHGEVSNSQIATILCDNTNPRECVQKLIETALEHGGKDNVSVIIACVESDLNETLAGHKIGEIVHNKKLVAYLADCWVGHLLGEIYNKLYKMKSILQKLIWSFIKNKK